MLPTQNLNCINGGFARKPITIPLLIWRFAVNTFNKAKELFNEWGTYDLFVIDEVGKLELLHNSGFEPEFIDIISQYKVSKSKKTLLLVVRDTLVDAAFAKYGLQGARVVNSLEEL